MVEKDDLVARTREEMIYFKRELLNREENFNSKFNRQPNVGVMQVIKPREKNDSSSSSSVDPNNGHKAATGIGFGGKANGSSKPMYSVPSSGSCTHPPTHSFILTNSYSLIHIRPFIQTLSYATVHTHPIDTTKQQQLQHHHNHNHHHSRNHHHNIMISKLTTTTTVTTALPSQVVLSAVSVSGGTVVWVSAGPL